MIKVMIGGNFDPFHDGHLAYIKQAAEAGDYIICLLTIDKMCLAKKGYVNIPQEGRFEIMDLLLKGMGIPHEVVLNTFDTIPGLSSEALRHLKPAINFRAYMKQNEGMPVEEEKACEELGIKVMYAHYMIERHGRMFE